ncbi:MAG: peroxiredoxin [Methylacidiphilales bacterium]|nr:peroxiredoxin [Candidatus Methylacidiphilales bacterium]
MPITINQQLPQGRFTVMKSGAPSSVSTDDLFSNKKVVLFSVPGAFTPTCSNDHLPGYIKLHQSFKEKGIDIIACLSVNDVFVMDAWCKQSKADETILFLADGNATYTKALGLELDATGYGMGIRGQRFSMFIEERVVKLLFIENDTGLSVSSAEHMLRAL